MSGEGKSAEQVCGRSVKELLPIIQSIKRDLNGGDGYTHGDIIERILEDDRLNLKEKIMIAHFLGKMTR